MTSKTNLAFAQIGIGLVGFLGMFAMLAARRPSDPRLEALYYAAAGDMRAALGVARRSGDVQLRVVIEAARALRDLGDGRRRPGGRLARQLYAVRHRALLKVPLGLHAARKAVDRMEKPTVVNIGEAEIVCPSHQAKMLALAEEAIVRGYCRRNKLVRPSIQTDSPSMRAFRKKMSR